jgi:hypothetical protein
MCTVPNLTNDWTDAAQADWSGAGFTLPVLFNPLNPPDHHNVLTQSIPKGTSALCSSTGITVTWKP